MAEGISRMKQQGTGGSAASSHWGCNSRERAVSLRAQLKCSVELIHGKQRRRGRENGILEAHSRAQFFISRRRRRQRKDTDYKTPLLPITVINQVGQI